MTQISSINGGKLLVGDSLTVSPQNIRLDGTTPQILIKSGLTGGSGGLYFTFNQQTSADKYAYVEMVFNTRATVGAEFGSGYPLTLRHGAATWVSLSAGGTVYAQFGGTQLQTDNVPIQVRSAIGGNILSTLDDNANGGLVEVWNTEGAKRVELYCDNADGANGFITVKNASSTITTTIAGDAGVNSIGLRLNEVGAAPSAVTNTARIYTEDNGAGKTRLMVRFQTGASVQIAIEP